MGGGSGGGGRAGRGGGGGSAVTGAYDLEKDHDAVYNSLTDAEKDALRRYSEEDEIGNYVDLNDIAVKDAHQTYLKNIGAATKSPRDTPENRATMAALDSAISKGTVGQDITAYRGISKGVYEELRISGSLREGKTTAHARYMSTTLDKGVATEFSRDYAPSGPTYLMKVAVPKGSKGLFVGKNSAMGHEKELLLPRGTKLKVGKIVHDKASNVVMLDMTVVP